MVKQVLYSLLLLSLVAQSALAYDYCTGNKPFDKLLCDEQAKLQAIKEERRKYENIPAPSYTPDYYIYTPPSTMRNDLNGVETQLNNIQVQLQRR